VGHRAALRASPDPDPATAMRAASKKGELRDAPSAPSEQSSDKIKWVHSPMMMLVRTPTPSTASLADERESSLVMLDGVSRGTSGTLGSWAETTVGDVLVGGLVRSLLMVLSLGYVTLMASLMSLVKCTSVAGRSVLLLDADVHCYVAWQYVVLLAICALSSYPFVVGTRVLVLVREAKQRVLSVVERVALLELGRPFRARYKWWESMLLVQRLYFVAVSSLFPAEHLVWRQWLLAMGAVAALVLHAAFHPMRNKTAHVCATFLHLVLVVMALRSLSDSVYEANGFPVSASERSSLNAFSWVLSLALWVPGVTSILYASFLAVRACKRTEWSRATVECCLFGIRGARRRYRLRKLRQTGKPDAVQTGKPDAAQNVEP